MIFSEKPATLSAQIFAQHTQQANRAVAFVPVSSGSPKTWRTVWPWSQQQVIFKAPFFLALRKHFRLRRRSIDKLWKVNSQNAWMWLLSEPAPLHLCFLLVGGGEQRLQLAVHRVLVLLPELLLELGHGSSGEIWKHTDVNSESWETCCRKN